MSSAHSTPLGSVVLYGHKCLISHTGYETPCWLWSASRRGKGYATVSVDNKLQSVHRLTYTDKYGDIPDGLQLDHLCRIPHCVNPEHLEAVDCATNVRRGNRAKLSIEQAREIRRLRQEGFLMHQIAERFNVSRPLVGYIVNNKIWVE